MLQIILFLPWVAAFIVFVGIEEARDVRRRRQRFEDLKEFMKRVGEWPPR